MLDNNDLTFVQNCLEEIEEDMGDVVYIYTTTGSTDTAGSLEPPTVTQIYTDRPTLNVTPVSSREIETSAGKYQSGDVKVSTVGSYTNKDTICWNSGTYDVIDGPLRVMLYSQPIKYNAVLRRAR